jgi:hypothetical protein
MLVLAAHCAFRGWVLLMLTDTRLWPMPAGAHAARMLHRVRRAERMLLSYERCGWLDDTPSRLTGRQVNLYRCSVPCWQQALLRRAIATLKALAFGLS